MEEHLYITVDLHVFMLILFRFVSVSVNGFRAILKRFSGYVFIICFTKQPLSEVNLMDVLCVKSIVSQGDRWGVITVLSPLDV